MTRKSTPRRPSPADATAVPAVPAASSRGAELAQQPFAAGGEAAALLLRGFETMRKIQEQASQQTLARHAAAVRSLGASAHPVEAFAVQSELLRGDLQDAARCWQNLFGEAVEVGNELMACSARLVNTDDVFAAARLFHRPND
jgi:hypothetical protein